MIFQTWWFPIKADFYSQMPKSKMAAENFGLHHPFLWIQVIVIFAIIIQDCLKVTPAMLDCLSANEIVPMK